MSDPRLIDLIALRLKERGHAGHDSYIGLEHRPVCWERYGTSSAVLATCACGAKLVVEVRT
jgi:hypothetical protein